MDTIGDKVEYISEIKGAIRGAIEGKGVDVPEGTPFMAYADKVGEISGTGGGHTILDGEGNALPQQPALQFTGNVAVTDGEGVTAVEVGSKQPGQIIGVWGTLERRAFAANTYTRVKFMPDYGDLSMINDDGEFVVPKSGVYKIFANIGGLPKTTTVNWVVLYKEVDGNIETISWANNENVITSPAFALAPLEKGDKIYVMANTNVAQTTLTSKSYFTITLDSSVDITVWDAYETWKSLDPENNTDDFDTWISKMLGQSAGLSSFTTAELSKLKNFLATLPE